MKHDHPEWFTLSMCEGKDQLTHKQAKAVQRRMKRKGRIVEAYHCHCCRQWHVGGKA